MKRVTLDSHVYLSTLVSGGKPKRILERAIEGEIEVAVSDSDLCAIPDPMPVCDWRRHPSPLAGAVHHANPAAGRPRAIMMVSSRAAHVLTLFVVLLGAVSCSRGQDASSASGAPPAAEQTVTTDTVTITFASESNPPKAGDNAFVVTVKQPDGAPITDGRVTAVFSMPAMPSMNMPAMRSDATLAHEGGGRYRGTGQLSMSGTWNVTIAVSRAGQALASARFSVIAK